MNSKKDDDDKYEKKRNSHDEESGQKWFQREELQDLAKMGGNILKKTVATGKEVFKEVKGNFPKEATEFISKGKDELLKGISKEMAGRILISTMEKLFDLACQHRLEFTVSINKKKKNGNLNKKTKRR